MLGVPNWAYATALFVCLFFVPAKCDDSPGFFLKITKNVPRLGRRADKEYENYFLKNFDQMPHLGVDRGEGYSSELSAVSAWLGDSSQLSKRALMHPAAAAAAAEREYSVVQPVNANTLLELLDKDAIPSENVKFVHWKDFDRALQFDTDLYAKVISLGRKPDQRLKQDLSLGSYIPLFGSGADTGADVMFYNKGDQSGKYESDYLLYNHLK